MSKIIVFGVGFCLKQNIQYVDIDEVLCFVDNSQNHMFCGKQVLRPCSIPSFEYDYIVVFSQKYSNDMYLQLMEMNIPSDKIISWQYYLYILRFNVKNLSRCCLSQMKSFIQKFNITTLLDIESGLVKNGLHLRRTSFFNYKNMLIDNYDAQESIFVNNNYSKIYSEFPEKKYQAVVCLDFFHQSLD